MPHFPNLAGVDGCDDTVQAELEAAGVPVSVLPFGQVGEVPTRVVGFLHGWRFTRAWRYWVVSGSGMPPTDAEALHATHGQVCRVAGHCGCPSPLEHYDGFAVPLYHVDTAEGLRALADMISAVYQRAHSPTP